MPPLRNDLARASDEELVQRACDGDRGALGALLSRHQHHLYNVAIRVLQTREDAEDAVQEILVKIATHIGSFRGDSTFRTWAYQIAMRHLLDRKRSRPECAVRSFECYRTYLDGAPNEAFDQNDADSPEQHLLVAEARLSCTLGMLLCLDRTQRLVFILGEIFEVSDTIGGAFLQLGRDNFRQQLARARAQLASFMRDRCGLVDQKNPCRCARKTRAFVRDGVVDPTRLVFTHEARERATRTATDVAHTLDATMLRSVGDVYRSHPQFEGPDIATRILKSLEQPNWQALLGVNESPS